MALPESTGLIGLITAVMAGVPAMVTTILVFRNKQKKELEDAQNMFVERAKEEVARTQKNYEQRISAMQKKLDALEARVENLTEENFRLLNILARNGLLHEVVGEEK